MQSTGFEPVQTEPILGWVTERASSLQKTCSNFCAKAPVWGIWPHQTWN